MKKRQQVESIMFQILKESNRKIEVKELAWLISQKNKSNFVSPRLLGIISAKNPMIIVEKKYLGGTTCVSYYFDGQLPNSDLEITD